MGREPITDTVVGLSVTSSPLPFPKAQELIPDIMKILGLLGASVMPLVKGGLKTTDDVMKLGPVIAALGNYLADGKLEWLAPKILASTVVIADGEKYELLKDQERNNFFNEHPEAFIPMLVFAGRITFARFFPERGLLGGLTQRPSS